MWVFLSRRLRSWLLLAVLVPLFGRVVRQAHAASSRRDADSRLTSALGAIDKTVSRLTSRGRRGKSKR